MSAEDIFSNYPPEESYSQFLTFEAEKKGIDPVIYSAQEMVKAGRDSLLSRRSEFDELYEELSPEEMKDLVVESTIDEWSAIMLGHLIAELNFAMKTGRFEVGAFVGKFNFSITGTLLPHMRMPEDISETIVLDQNELEAIKNLYSGNKTFANIFRKPERLPKEIERFFRDELTVLKTDSFHRILSLWEQRAILLIPKEIPPANSSDENEDLSNPLAGFSHAQIADFMRLREKFEAGEI